MSKSHSAPSRRFSCTGIRSVEVDFTHQIQPRLAIPFSEGLSLLPGDRAVVPPAAGFVPIFRKHLTAKGGRVR